MLDLRDLVLAPDGVRQPMPRVQLTPFAKVALHFLRAYLLVMLTLLVLRFTHVL